MSEWSEHLNRVGRRGGRDIIVYKTIGEARVLREVAITGNNEGGIRNILDRKE